MKLPPSVPAYFTEEEKIVKWLSQLTNKSPISVRSRLQKERDNPGINVSEAMHQYGIEPHIWTDKLMEFYSQTDAFLYELIVWNFNKCKRRMRRRIGKYIDKNLGQQLDILTIGDGLGVDSIYLTRAGHHVTYYETSAYALTFAKMLFADYAKDIKVLEEPNQIAKNSYDIVICLDVLEHVSDPSEFVKNITSYLKLDGHLIVHAPFYQIHPSTPTHLKSNRKYSGSLGLYTKHGLKLVDGERSWDPITLKKISGRKVDYSSLKPKLLALRLAGLYLALGRFTILPFLWINSYQRRGRRWFNDS
ncbi:MAG: class I SAM-dependent methyltransferase [Planctomycetota bacterium]|jgi:2-polyprenyl-3-methyl-5-hydroxy-6-metoxy-1,4-benzoquinol methylase